jgi:thioredoxin-related protein
MRLLSIIITLGVVTITSIQAQNWQTDIDQAKVLAAKENRKIVLVFQGSDWCAPCIKLEREIWSTEEFNDYAKDHFIMLQADFPRKKNNQLSVDLQEHNNKLAERYNKNGYFPFVLVLDKEGRVLGETGYKKMSPSEYIKLLESFNS